MDSHLIRKAAWRLPALAGIGVLRFNTRGTSAGLGSSEGTFEGNAGEGQDLAAALAEVVAQGFPDPWAVGWSFGTDVIVRWGNVDPVAGAVLLSPPGRWSDDGDVAGWATSGRPLTALVPELDEFATPDEVEHRYAAVPQARVIGVPGRQAPVGGRAPRADRPRRHRRGPSSPDAAPLPTTWYGPMERWSDLRPFAPHGPRGLSRPTAGAPTDSSRAPRSACTYFA